MGFVFISLGYIVADNIPGTREILASFETQTLDLRYRIFNNRYKVGEDVIVIDIDDESIKELGDEYGRWPWPRSFYKNLIEFINYGQPSAILFDFLFTEEQKTGDGDTLLAQVSQVSNNVSHSVFLLKSTNTEGQDFNPLTDEVKHRLRLSWLDQESSKPKFTSIYKDYLSPFPELLQNTHIAHVVNVEPDNDAILRRIPLLIPFGSEFLPSLAMRGILSKTQAPQITFNGHEILILDNHQLRWKIPLDENYFLPLHFYHKSKNPLTFRALEVIRSLKQIQRGETDITLNPEIFQGKIILIGTSAIGINDLKVTPLGYQVPGVYLHATGIANVLANDYLKKADTWVLVFCTFFLVFIIELFLFGAESFVIRNLIPPLALIIYVGVVVSFFYFESVFLPMASPVLFGTIALLDGYIYLGLVEGRARRKMESTLSKYLSPNVTKHLISSGVDPTAEVGSSKELTVLFSDIRGFTTLSEKMPPVALVHLLNEYLSKMTDIVFDHDGTLDKFIGDAVMAFWGAPLDDPEHSKNAVRTALHMVHELELLNSQWKSQNLPALNIGIGILTGNVIVGNIGGAKRIDYTVIGDNVNTTSRLEGLTKEYDCNIIIAESTYDKIQHDFVIRNLDMVIAKGKSKAIKIFEPLAEKGQGAEVSKKEILCFKFNLAWNLYHSGDFSEALNNFNQILKEYPDDGPTKVYIERCQHLILDPPAEWTGIFVATHK